MSAIVATQRIVGGKPAGGKRGLTQSDLNGICRVLGISNPDNLPVGAKCTYMLVLRTSEKIPKTVKSTGKARKKK